MNKVKQWFKGFVHILGKPVKFFGRKTEKAREFMKKGRAGGMLAELILLLLFSYWIIKGTFYTSKVVGFFLTLIIFIVFAELLNLVIKLLFGGGKRSKAYFMTTWFIVSGNNLIANQMNAVLPALLKGFLLTLAADVIGRCIFGFARTKRFKQVFGYVAFALAAMCVALFSLYFFRDDFGESRVEFYNEVKAGVVSEGADESGGVVSEGADESGGVVSEGADESGGVVSEGADESGEVVADGFDAYLCDGNCHVLTIQYGPDPGTEIITETVDYSVFDSVQNRGFMEKLSEATSDYDFAKTPVTGVIWYPEDKKNCPVLFFVHGNHDSGTPSYMGYEYLGRYLASNGYVVVSVDENIINRLGEGNDKRALLLLDNMKAILGENKREGSPIFGLIDENKVAIGGHSRGGEMVATAFLFNDYDVYPEDGNIKLDYHFNISAIIAMAPVVDQYRPVNHSVEIADVDYLLIHGSNDQDVSNMMGEKQYNNVRFNGDEIHSEDSKGTEGPEGTKGSEGTEGPGGTGGFHFKSSVYILGANHGQFNSLWGQYDMEGASNGFLNTNNFISESDQKQIAKAYIRAFLDTALGIDDTYASFMKGNSAYQSYLPDTVYITNYSDSEFVELCNFDDTTNISGEEGVNLDCTGMDTWTIKAYERGDGGEGDDYVLSCKYLKDSRDPAVKVTFPAIDISDGGVSFRIADMREDTEDLAEGLAYTVELTDTAGRIARVSSPELVYHTLAVQLYKDDVFFGSYEYKHQLQTVVVTPAMIGGADFDCGSVVGMRIIADGAQDGEIIINDIGYWGE